MTGRTNRSIRIAVVTAAALLALAVGGGGPAAAAATDASSRLDFKAEPEAGSSTEKAGSYFVIDAQPGQRVRQAVALTNETGSPITLVMHAEAATSGPLGGVSYGVLEREPDGTEVSWLTLARSRVTLAPHASVSMPFVVTMPRNERHGTHLAGISIERISNGASRAAGTARGAGAGVVVHSRRVIAVRVNTPGPRVDKLTIDAVTATARPDGMFLLAHISNDGNTLLTATGDLEVVGDVPLNKPFDIDTLVPQTTIQYPIRWTDRPRQGEFPVSLELTFDGRTVRWSGTVKVGEAEIREFEDRSGKDAAQPHEREYLWLALVTGVLLVLGAVALLRRRAVASGIVAGHDRAGSSQ